jgi:hypothetical protein
MMLDIQIYGLIAKEQREKKREEKRDGALLRLLIHCDVCHGLVGVTGRFCSFLQAPNL